MSSLIVLLPSADAQKVDMRGFDAMPMPFALLDRSGETMRTGRAPLAELPRALATVLVVAARDTLLLKVNLPPVTGPRLKRVLPNVVEEHLIQDAQQSHIAVGPDIDPQGERCAAVVDREWFAGVIDRFVAAGHRRLRAVPLIHCIPLLDAQAASQPAHEDAEHREQAAVAAGDASFGLEEDEATPEPNSAEANTDLAASALIVRHGVRSREHDGRNVGNDSDIGDTPSDPLIDASRTSIGDGDEPIEIAVRQGAIGFGMTIRAAQLDTTIAELAKRQPLAVYSLAFEPSAEHGHDHASTTANANHAASARNEPRLATSPIARPTDPRHASPPTSAAFPLAALTLPWPTLARDALACRFDLCQFEFANSGRSRPGTGGFKPWRIAIGFVAATLIVSLVAVNVQWFQLRHRRDALNAQMTELVKTAFPDATVILDPHAQMATGLARLRSAAGELSANDFPVLAAGLSRALGPIPSSAIAGLDYNGGNALDVTFKPGTTVDSDGLTRRLAAQGLSAQEDNGKWSIRSAQR
jgi:general secretion pathway protein L